ncbi:MAG: hypothetical protein BJ554DRAFT_2013 [Olpidium bornovanus]|uniref:Uncharacterized protein n=1 Tax=Olpidium bornovanus TaxID=278681 RepID=A0A8H8DH86_9FUNG|nr:MAG: hypothetical protein BJ554DRAFT_2013 [Olpidium bornovanus]
MVVHFHRSVKFRWEGTLNGKTGGFFTFLLTHVPAAAASKTLKGIVCTTSPVCRNPAFPVPVTISLAFSPR